jgi:DNA invertase Pin-like site-specific DNA recombinase
MKRDDTLLWGAFRRVSTDRQMTEGESLAVQTAAFESDRKALGGKLVGWYGGSEHGTEGFDRPEFDRLLADAASGKVNAVWFADWSRYSRNPLDAARAVEVFQSAGTKLFIGSAEQNLYDPQSKLVGDVFAALGRFQALQQSMKSLKSKISRARDGRPSCGKLPYGRKWVKKGSDEKAGPKDAGEWKVIEKDRAALLRAAHRYLAGEPLPVAARAEGFAPTTLHRAFATAGSKWVQTFESDRLNIRETVVTEVPALLDDDLLARIRDRAEAGKTYLHDAPKNPYLLGRVVFCSECGSAMSGTKLPGALYYRHVPAGRLALAGMKPCSCASSRVNAKVLEASVLDELFDLFGNPSAVARAVAAAVPDAEATEAARRRLDVIPRELDDVSAGRDRILRLVEKGTVTEAQAEARLNALKEKETVLAAERDRLKSKLAYVPDPSEVADVADRLSRTVRRFLTPRGFVATEDAKGVKRIDGKMWAVVSTINHDRAGISFEEARDLVRKVFGGRTADGRRMGVYIDGRRGTRNRAIWDYRMIGKLLDDLPGSAPGVELDEPRGGPLQESLLAEGEPSFRSWTRIAAPDPPAASCIHPPPGAYRGPWPSTPR